MLPCLREMSGTILKVFTSLVTSATVVTIARRHSRPKMLSAFMFLEFTEMRSSGNRAVECVQFLALFLDWEFG